MTVEVPEFDTFRCAECGEVVWLHLVNVHMAGHIHGGE